METARDVGRQGVVVLITHLRLARGFDSRRAPCGTSRPRNGNKERTVDEPTNSRGETFYEFVARRTGGEPQEMNRPEREGFPPGWDRRERKQADRHPPDFDAQESTAITWAEIHGRMWSPRVEDVRRLEGGKAALLLKDRKQDWLMVVLDGLEVEDIGTRTQFYEREEVVL